MGLKAIDENQTKKGFITAYTYEVDDKIVSDLEEEELKFQAQEQLKRLFSGESSSFDDSFQLTCWIILSKWKNGDNITDKELEFLDKNNKRLIFHTNVSDMTPRETFYLFLDQYFEWNTLLPDERIENIVYLNGLWRDYKNFCFKYGIGEKKWFKRREIKEYFLSMGFHAMRKDDDDGSRLVAFRGFPPLRNNANRPAYIIAA